MMEEARRPCLDARFYLILVAAGVATFVVHEGAHWIAGRLVGLDVSFSLNGVKPIGPSSETQHLVMSAAGPAVTIVQALVALAAVERRASTAAFAFLLWAAFMRVVASGLSTVLPNDEARVGTVLGLGYWTLPVVVSLALCGMAWVGA